jgi:hypothetical protein
VPPVPPVPVPVFFFLGLTTGLGAVTFFGVTVALAGGDHSDFQM